MTKAETLESLSGVLRSCQVPKLCYFTVREWRRGAGSRRRLMARVRATLRGPLAVRSSARGEDSPEASLAGHYLSRLGVPTDGEALESAIEAVARSLGDGGHQVLLQEMVLDAAVGGVVMTRDPSTGGPYYSVSYDETGRADRVTAGRGWHKTVLLHRGAEVAGCWLAGLLAMARELENRFPDGPLDIEFAMRRDGVFCLLQVRPLTARASWSEVRDCRVANALRQAKARVAGIDRPVPGVAGGRTLLGLMPDWNPAELIGAEPSPLALSLFRHLIADSVWWRARASMGYRRVQRPLLHPVAGRPYVDVRHSFNSFLPARLPEPLAEALVEAWMARLSERPELHDKVEFEVVPTAWDLSFHATFLERYPDVLDPGRLRLYGRLLKRLTRRNLSLSPEDSLPRALALAARLDQASREPAMGRGPKRALALSLRRLDRCRRFGTFPFAVVARHAFIAESLLRSAVQAEALDASAPERLKQGIDSVAARIRRDFHRTRRGEMAPAGFLAQYGHLRPGLFDIASPRYDRRPDLFSGVLGEDFPPPPKLAATFGSRGLSRLDRALATAGLSIEGRDLLAYSREAIRQREEVKFQFSRPLSDALEGLARWGDWMGLSREEVSYLTLDDWLDRPHRDRSEWRDVSDRRHETARHRRGLRLGPLLRHALDLDRIELSDGRANFVTSKTAVGRPLRLENRSPLNLDLVGRIACLDCADPGFDWLFSRGVAGLITKFGGSNSHMAIRCAELSVPAAIGVGEGLFDQLLDSPSIELRCRERVVRPLGV